MEKTLAAVLIGLGIAALILLVAGFISAARTAKRNRQRLAKDEEERKRREQQEEEARKEAVRQAIRECVVIKHSAPEKAPDAETHAKPRKDSAEVPYEKLNVADFTPISKRRFVVVDTETTGVTPSDSIIEIAAVRVEDGQITAEFQTLVNPERHIPGRASSVNHITDDMVADAPTIHQALPSFLEFAGEDVLVGHNVAFDARFIQAACECEGIPAPARYFNTILLARYWDTPDKKLSTLLTAAGIENDAEHRALGDARATAQLVLATNARRKDLRAAKKAAKAE